MMVGESPRHQRKGVYVKGLGGLPIPRLYVVLQTGSLCPDSVQSSSVRHGRGLLRVSFEVGPLRRVELGPNLFHSGGFGWPFTA